MSTYIHLQCLSHHPPLVAEGESGQHLYDLPQLREDIANRALIVAALSVDCWPEERFRRNTALFLRGHPTCLLGIVDEYGKDHPLVAPEEQP